MDYLKIFNEDIAFNAANPRYRNDASDDEYGERRNGFWIKNIYCCPIHDNPTHTCTLTGTKHSSEISRILNTF